MSVKSNNSELNEPLINYQEALASNKSDASYEQHQAKPVVWISLSIIIALMFACGNIVLSYLSGYGFRVLELESPSGTITNLLTLAIISYYYKCKSKEDNSEGSSLDWFYQIFLKNYSADKVEMKRRNYSIYWTRIFVLIVVLALHIIQHWTFIISYQYATMANLNNGIVMTVLASKPIFSSTYDCYFLNKLTIVTVWKLYFVLLSL